MSGVPRARDAELAAETLLAPLGDRWLHTQSVAARARELARAVPAEDRGLLIVTAWLHDLGHSPALRTTGLHQLDGARYIAGAGYPRRLCALVAHHSAATFEAEECGLLADLSEWSREESPVADALWMADMTTGPGGEYIAYPERLDEILHRYEPDSAVSRAMRRARPSIESAISRTRSRLAS